MDLRRPGAKCVQAELIAQLAQPTAILSSCCHFVAANAAFRQRLGVAEDGIIGQHLTSLLNDADKQLCAKLHQDMIASPDLTLAKFEVSLRANGLCSAVVVSPLAMDGDVRGYLCQPVNYQSEEDLRLQYLMEYLDQGVWDYDTATARFTVSGTWRHMRGIGPNEEINIADRDWLEDIHPDDRATLREVFEGQTRGDLTSIDIQYRRKHKEGHWFWILCRAKVVAVDGHGKPNRIIGTDTDISALKQKDQELGRLTRKLRLAIDVSGMGVWEFDPVSNTVHWDDRLLEMYGLKDGSHIRHRGLWETYIHPDDRDATVSHLQHCREHGLDFRHDFRIIRPDGEIRHIRSLAGGAPDPKLPLKHIGVNIDVTADYRRSQELERARAQLEYDSRHDALTGLANRRLLDEQTALLLATATDDCSYAVLHIDLDLFKTINDTRGHAAGDAVLVHVAEQLKQIAGSTGLTSRVGGDEFVILFRQAPDPPELRIICGKIVAMADSPIIYDGEPCGFGISLGCAVDQGPMTDRSKIFKRADKALYAAKQAGRGCYRIWSPDQTP